MTGEKSCYWCHEPLPPLPDDATYVDEINHYIHDDCRDARDELNRRRDELERRVAEGLDNIPTEVRERMLTWFEERGFARRCPCLYDPAFGFKGYRSHTWGDEDELDYDARNAIPRCRLCSGTGTHDPLPELLELRDDAAAARWVEEHLPKGAGPTRIEGWYYSALGYARTSKKTPAGVTLFNYDTMQGGTIAWLELADRFRPRTQSSLF